jgi:tetrahydromethanopterin S-methyltransferase subunit D
MTAEAASADDETTTALAAATKGDEDQQQEQQYPDLSLNDIIDGDNGRGIPSVKFVSEDVGVFVDGIFGGSQQDNVTGAAALDWCLFSIARQVQILRG